MSKEIEITTKGPIGEDGIFQLTKFEKELGYVGKFFGGVEHAFNNMLGMAVFIVFIVGAVVIFWSPLIDPWAYWKTIILPTLTFLFGKNQRNSK